MTPAEEDVILAQAAAIEASRRDRLREKAEAVEAKLKAGEPFADAELVYAAYARCPCGEGLAYPRDVGMHGYWDCAGILSGRVPHPRLDPDEAKRHTGVMPFAFWEVKSELQPSARGATTRPGGEA